MSGLLGGGSKPQPNTTQNQLSGLSVQTSSQGVCIPIVFGTTRITTNNIWYGDFTAIPHVESTGSSGGGGKGGLLGGSSNDGGTNTTYTYKTAIQQGLCEGPIGGVGVVWSQKNVTSTGALGLTVFTGTYTQEAWDYLTTAHPTEALAYRGLAHVDTAAFNLGDSNSLPNLSYEVYGFGADAGGAWSTTLKNNNITLSSSSRIATAAAIEASQSVLSTAFKSSGKWYCEITLNSANLTMIGLGSREMSTVTGFNPGSDENGYGYYSLNGHKYTDNDGGAVYGATFTNGNIIGVAWDADAGTLTFYKNNASQGVAYSGIAGEFAFAASVYNGGSITANFGRTAFTYTPPVGFSGVYAQESLDVNIATVVDELLSNVYWGAEGKVALADITDFTLYCEEAGFKVSPAYTAQQPCAQMISDLLELGIAAPFMSSGELKIVPFADSPIGAYTPETTVRYYLTDDDFLFKSGSDPVKRKRRRPADAYNMVTIICKDRDNAYNTAVVEAKDQAAIDDYGLIPLNPINADMLCDLDIARDIAQAILQRVLYFPTTYEFVLPWDYGRLEQMDIVAITDAGLGLDERTVRILSIEEDDNGDRAITAEDFTTGVSNPESYGTQAASGAIVDMNANPGNANEPTIFQPPLSISTVPQIWLGTSGGSDWGGSQVWVSTDGGDSYSQIGVVTQPARHGTLTAGFPIGTSPDTVNTLAVQLLNGTLISVTTDQADALNTLCYVGGTNAELVAYRDAALTGTLAYNLTYIPRGKDWTFINAHLTGDDFMRLDSAVFKANIQEEWYNTTIKIKLLSFNSVGGGLQVLEDVAPIDYLVLKLGQDVSNGIIPNILKVSRRLYIPENTQFNMNGSLTIYGEAIVRGTLQINN